MHRWAKKKVAMTSIRRLDPKILFCSESTFEWMLLRKIVFALTPLGNAFNINAMGRSPLLGDAKILEEDLPDLIVVIRSFGGAINHINLEEGHVHEGRVEGCGLPSCVIAEVMCS